MNHVNNHDEIERRRRFRNEIAEIHRGEDHVVPITLIETPRGSGDVDTRVFGERVEPGHSLCECPVAAADLKDPFGRAQVSHLRGEIIEVDESASMISRMAPRTDPSGAERAVPIPVALPSLAMAHGTTNRAPWEGL